MLLPSFFSRENLTGWLSLSTLIKALRTVMGTFTRKARALNQPIIYEGRLDCQCRLGAWSSLLSRCVFFPFLAMSSSRLIRSQGRFLDGRKRRRKHRDGHRLIAGVLIPSSLLPPPQSSPRPELEHGTNTVRDGTVDYR
jgi:hypothetical protein